MVDSDGAVAVYRYPFDSTLDRGGLSLAASGVGGAGGSFFSGFAEHPKVLAESLLVLARISRTRFYVPPGMLAAVLRAADPVVTVSPGAMRFEAFSACCGVYARLDLDAAALDVETRRSGVTNVDVNPPLRAALASLRQGEPLHLTVSSDALAVTTLDAVVREEKVPLPRRWIKGFAETQVALSAMDERLRVDASTARRLIRSLPKSSTTRSAVWVVRAGAGGLRVASAPSATGQGVPLAGPERLRTLEPLLQHGTRLRAYASGRSPAPTSSAWVLDVPGGRFTLALSPDKSRGFSGEGGLLDALLLGGADRATDAQAIDSALDVGEFVSADSVPLPLTRERAGAALAVLASAGRLGYDLEAAAFFHRPFPLADDAFEDVDILHPRLTAAHALVADGAVSERDGMYTVTSGTQTYTVRDRGNDGFSCTCPWYAKHTDTRGPCKHILAARLVAPAS